MRDRKKRIRFLVKLLVSAGLLSLIFSMVPLTGVAQAFQTAVWGFVAAGILIMALSRYVKSVQMYFITRHLNITLSPGRIFVVNLITSFYGLFLPGVLAGGAIRWYHFSRQDNMPAQALAAIILNRVLETSMLICLGLGFWLIDSKASDSISMEVLLLLTVVSLLVYMISFSRRIHKWLLRLTDFRLVPLWIGTRAEKVLSALGRYEDLPRSRHLTILLLGVACQFLGLATLYLLSLALGLNVEIATLGWIRSIVAIAMFIPASIGGLGVREATFIAFLIPYGIATNDALTLSLLVFASGLIFSFAGGIVEAKRLVFERKAYAR